MDERRIGGGQRHQSLDRASTSFVRSTSLGSPSNEDAEYGAVDDSNRKRSRPPLQRRSTFTNGEALFPSRYTTWTIDDDKESLDDVSIIINLLADLSPAGVLPLSFGMVGTGYLPALILLAVFASAAAYMMYLVSRTFETTREKSYDKMWAKVVTARSAWIPITTVLAAEVGCCLAYACMFGDLFAGCMPAFGVNWASRSVCLSILSFFPLLPLCMLKDLSLLAPTSFLAILAVFYTLCMMVFRYFNGDYFPGGQYYTMPRQSNGYHLFDFGAPSLLLVNGLAVAFLCHYNGCKYYRELIDKTPGKFRNRISIAFLFVSSMFVVAMLLGYATFGGNSEAVILNNYHSKDMAANGARFLMGVANVCSFPLMFSGLREQALALAIFLVPSMEATCANVWFQNVFSSIVLAVIMITAILVTDAGTVIGLVGSIAGAATIYVIPCVLFDFAHTQKDIIEGDRLYSTKEKILVRTIGVTGVFLIFAGAFATLCVELPKIDIDAST